MKVKFLKEVVSAFGTFFVDEVHHIEDEHVVSNWIENGLIKPFEEKVVTPTANAKEAPVEEATVEVADSNEVK